MYVILFTAVHVFAVNFIFANFMKLQKSDNYISQIKNDHHARMWHVCGFSVSAFKTTFIITCTCTCIYTYM